MPTLITTIEDFSPVIFYSGVNNWTAGTSSNDSSIDKYSDSSYTVTQVANASASFTFSGTGVQLYGAERANHGLYQVTIDSRIYAPVNGSVNGTEETFQTKLFQTVALKNGLHTVTIVNLGTMKLDLDFITWETPVGQDQESLLSSTNQDSDSSFKYMPASSWTTSPSNLGTFNGGSGHITSTAGAFVDYTFRGAAVAIFGPVGPEGAPYSVQLDNGATTNYSSWKQFYQPQTMLFQAGNLGSGAHTVRLRSEAWNNSVLTFAIDYAQVYSTPSLEPAAALAPGSIVAIIFGILLACIFIACGYQFYKYRRVMVTDSDSKTIFPFRHMEYHPLAYGQLPSQVSTPHTSINSGWSIAGTTSVRSSKLSNPEVLIANPQVPYIPDRKYRPDLESVTDLTSRHRNESSISSRRSPPPNTSQSSDFIPISYTTEPRWSREETRMSGNGRMVAFVLPSGAAPPIYAREQSE